MPIEAAEVAEAEGEKPYSDAEEIEECLRSKRIGFEEISSVTLGAIFHKAPQGETFTVPAEKNATFYKWIAKKGGRKDLKFVVGE